MIEKRSPWLEGTGLHTGAPCAVQVVSAERGTGLELRRVDRETAPIAISPNAVVSTDRRTVIELGRSGRDRVSTVEHLLGALAGLGVWDARIQVRGPEIPALDGSAQPFVEALEDFEETARAPIVLETPIRIARGSSTAVAEPAEQLSIEAHLSYEHPAVGEQRASWSGDAAEFAREIAPARTFGFLDEVAKLRGAGLAMGGSLDNALVYGPEGALRPERLDGEPARHKILDAIGDLALLGAPLRARIELDRPGHTLSVALAGAIQESLRS